MDIPKIRCYMKNEILEKIISVAKSLSMDDLKKSLGDYYFVHSFDDATDIFKVQNNMWRVCMEDGTSHLVTNEGLKAELDYDNVADYLYKLSDVVNTSKTYNKYFRS